jgi:hypothetical protein
MFEIWLKNTEAVAMRREVTGKLVHCYTEQSVLSCTTK